MRISGITYVPRKTHKARNVILTLIVLILLSAFTILLISAYTGWSLTHPSRKDIPAFSSNIVPEYKDVSFKDIQGKINLKGWYFESRNSTKTVILAHGYRNNRLQFGEQTLDMIKVFLLNGYNVLAFDFRNSGLSEGKMTTVGFYEEDDLLGAVKYVKSQNSKNIILLGFSMGASTSILAAADSKDVDAVIADSPFSDLGSYLDGNLSVWSPLPSIFNGITLMSVKTLLGIDPSSVSPKNAIGRIAPRPVMFIHSKADRDIPVSNSAELYRIYSAAAGNNTEFWQLENAGHAKAYTSSPKEYMDRVLKFLEKVK